MANRAYTISTSLRAAVPKLHALCDFASGLANATLCLIAIVSLLSPDPCALPSFPMLEGQQ
ncbi:hypothetical protein [Gluconobacter oxydans]|uniref:hypothetical protein n=1 Tax=Gluconobacter oxydans TaxID=442 RepID=UPI00062C2562|nr:hypothetical protein [Gluconobacter oxydans]